MKILLISDVESPYLWDYFQRGRLDDIDLILSCGDLKPQYLSFLVTMGHAPVLYVHGNHDTIYATRPPEGCDCIEDKVVTVKGLRIMGLGGSILYSGGEHQFSERQMRRRIRKLRFRLWRTKGVDIVLTHSPARGYGDAEDYAHRGFQCFVDLMDRYRPQYFIHGHVHATYSTNMERVHHYGDTTIINAYERYVLEI
jgi:Icc-related predicted phosphoesterase